MAQNIWLLGIKSIIGFTKRSLLDYIDAIEASSSTHEEKERLGKVKGRIHNDLSQAEFHIGTMITSLQSGGDITPFEADILRRPPERSIRSGGHQPYKNGGHQPFKNLEVKKEEEKK